MVVGEAVTFNSMEVAIESSMKVIAQDFVPDSRIFHNFHIHCFDKV